MARRPRISDAPEGVAGLRTRYAPKARIHPGLVAVAPWASLLVIFWMFLVLDGRMVLEPGVVAQLPSGPFVGGTRGGLVAAVLPVEPRAGEPARQIVFFDDERFAFDRPEDRERLRERLHEKHELRSDAALVIRADARVPHGAVVELSRMAAEVGVREINFALRPEE
jgi:hypothetical protein